MGQSSSKSSVVEGFVAPGYENVRTMFERNFSRGAEESSQLCVYVGEEVVVDLWGSTSHSNYTGDTLTNVFSSTKSITAIAMAALVDLGLMNYSDRICQYWPEFAENGKEQITIADLMRHEAGLANLDTLIDMEDTLRENIKRNCLGEVIARQKCVYPEGSKREYHTITRGWVANEIFRRVHPEGKTIGEFVEEKFARPLEADIYIGVPASREEDYAPVHEIDLKKMIRESLKPASTRGIALGFVDLMKTLNEFRKLGGFKPTFKQYKDYNMKLLGPLYNIDVMRRGETSSANGNCSARGLAKLAAVMANQGTLGELTLLSNKAWQALHSGATKATWMGFETNFTQGGVSKFEEEGGRDGYYGWFGYGGSVFQWHPDLNIGFGYTPALLHWEDWTNSIGTNLQQEVVKCVQKLKK